MAGKKRSAPDVEAKEARSSKAAKTEAIKPPKAIKGGSKIKASLTSTQFKAKALPLHANFTHTPAPALEDQPEKDGTIPVTVADPGAIGSTTLLPAIFSTGSYGWKGSKRVTIELPNPDGETGEKVQVMISINATVLGSKNADNTAEKSGENDESSGEVHTGENGNEEEQEDVEN